MNRQRSSDFLIWRNLQQNIHRQILREILKFHDSSLTDCSLVLHNKIDVVG
jgi:hypothetical protein